MNSDIKSLVLAFEDMCGESDTEMGRAALRELDFDRKDYKRALSFLELAQDEIKYLASAEKEQLAAIIGEIEAKRGLESHAPSPEAD